MDQLPELTLQNRQHWFAQPLLLVDAWAPSCVACLAMRPLLEKLNQQHPALAVVTLNVEQQTELAAELNIRSLPEIVLLSAASEWQRRSGVLTENQLQRLLAPYLDNSREQQWRLLAQQRQQVFQPERWWQAIDCLREWLHEAPEQGELRALLIHYYLDIFRRQSRPDCLQAAQQLLQANQFDWLRSPQVQQASARLQLLSGVLSSQQDLQLQQQIGNEQYEQAAERLLQQPALYRDDPGLLFRLLDVLPDRRRANQLRRRFIAQQKD